MIDKKLLSDNIKNLEKERKNKPLNEKISLIKTDILSETSNEFPKLKNRLFKSSIALTAGSTLYIFNMAASILIFNSTSLLFFYSIITLGFTKLLFQCLYKSKIIKQLNKNIENNNISEPLKKDQIIKTLEGFNRKERLTIINKYFCTISDTCIKFKLPLYDSFNNEISAKLNKIKNTLKINSLNNLLKMVEKSHKNLTMARSKTISDIKRGTKTNIGKYISITYTSLFLTGSTSLLLFNLFLPEILPSFCRLKNIGINEIYGIFFLGVESIYNISLHFKNQWGEKILQKYFIKPQEKIL